MNKLYIVTQSFAENKGSFSGVIEDFAKHISTGNKGYEIIILCAKNNEKEKTTETLSYAKVIRFPRVKAPFLANIVQGLYFASKVNSYLKNRVSKDDLIFANGEAALGVIAHKYIVRAGDQPAFIFLKNMEIAKKQVSIVTRIARFVHVSIQYLLECVYITKAAGIVYASEETRGLFAKYYHCGNKPWFVPRSGVEI